MRGQDGLVPLFRLRRSTAMPQLQTSHDNLGREHGIRKNQKKLKLTALPFWTTTIFSLNLCSASQLICKNSILFEDARMPVMICRNFCTGPSRGARGLTTLRAVTYEEPWKNQ